VCDQRAAKSWDRSEEPQTVDVGEDGLEVQLVLGNVRMLGGRGMVQGVEQKFVVGGAIGVVQLNALRSKVGLRQQL